MVSSPKIILLLLGFMLFRQFVWGQSPWTKSKSEGYTQIGYTLLPTYQEILQSSGESKLLERQITDQTFQLYTEVGLAEKLSLIAFIPFKILEAQGLNFISRPKPLTEKGKLNAFGNARLGLKKGFTTTSIEQAFELQIELPTSAQNLNSGLVSGFDAFAYAVSYSIGKSFSQNLYGFAYGGAIIRSNGFSNQFRLGFEGGYSIKQKAWFILYLDYLGLIEQNQKSFDPRQEINGLYLDEQSYLSPGLKLIYPFPKKWFLNLGVGGAIQANNLAASPALSLGLAKEW
ncbi:MAG: hypothetical protein RIC95_12410 [Vicingaceae bacterium]